MQYFKLASKILFIVSGITHAMAFCACRHPEQSVTDALINVYRDKERYIATLSDTQKHHLENPPQLTCFDTTITQIKNIRDFFNTKSDSKQNEIINKIIDHELQFPEHNNAWVQEFIYDCFYTDSKLDKYRPQQDISKRTALNNQQSFSSQQSNSASTMIPILATVALAANVKSDNVRRLNAPSAINSNSNLYPLSSSPILPHAGNDWAQEFIKGDNAKYCTKNTKKPEQVNGSATPILSFGPSIKSEWIEHGDVSDNQSRYQFVLDKQEINQDLISIGQVQLAQTVLNANDTKQNRIALNKIRYVIDLFNSFPSHENTSTLLVAHEYPHNPLGVPCFYAKIRDNTFKQWLNQWGHEQLGISNIRARI